LQEELFDLKIAGSFLGFKVFTFSGLEMRGKRPGTSPCSEYFLRFFRAGNCCPQRSETAHYDGFSVQVEAGSPTGGCFQNVSIATRND